MSKLGAYVVVWHWPDGTEWRMGPGFRLTKAAAQRRLRAWRKRIARHDRSRSVAPDLRVEWLPFFSCPEEAR